jgi:hypothetical protein
MDYGLVFHYRFLEANVLERGIGFGRLAVLFGRDVFDNSLKI